MCSLVSSRNSTEKSVIKSSSTSSTVKLISFRRWGSYPLTRVRTEDINNSSSGIRLSTLKVCKIEARISKKALRLLRVSCLHQCLNRFVRSQFRTTHKKQISQSLRSSSSIDATVWTRSKIYTVFIITT